MIERMKIALRPLLHHGLDAYPDVETEAARRVLAAMREPSEAMEQASADIDVGTGEASGPRYWSAMIDAALADDGR